MQEGLRGGELEADRLGDGVLGEVAGALPRSRGLWRQSLCCREDGPEGCLNQQSWASSLLPGCLFPVSQSRIVSQILALFLCLQAASP